MTGLITSRESTLLGQVRLLRNALFDQLRRPSTETRKAALAALESTEGDFLVLPEPYGDDDWLCLHTVERVASLVELLGREAEADEGRFASITLRAVEAAALHDAAAEIRLVLGRDDGGDTDDEHAKRRAVERARRADAVPFVQAAVVGPLSELLRGSDEAARRAHRFHRVVTDYLATLRLSIVEHRGVRGLDRPDPIRHFAENPHANVIGHQPLPGAALCGEAEPSREGWVVSHELAERFCPTCLNLADLRFAESVARAVTAPSESSLDPNFEFVWERGDGGITFAETPAGRYEISDPSPSVTIRSGGADLEPYIPTLDHGVIGYEPSLEAARTRCHEHYNALAGTAKEVGHV